MRHGGVGPRLLAITFPTLTRPSASSPFGRLRAVSNQSVAFDSVSCFAADASTAISELLRLSERAAGRELSRLDFTAARTEETLMVVRTRTQLGLRVAFYRADILTDTEVARTEEDARNSALAIIGRLDFLQAGDRLEVTEV
jgi:hypothetical protein